LFAEVTLGEHEQSEHTRVPFRAIAPGGVRGPDDAEDFGWRRPTARVERCRMAADHNTLAHTDKSEATGLATSAASASPMATASGNPLDH